VRFEFTIDGPPISQQSRSRRRLQDWKATVRTAASRAWGEAAPLEIPVRVQVTYFYDGYAPHDCDNIAKPIQDALQGLVYTNDRLVVDGTGRKRNINGSLRVRHMSVTLALAFSRGVPFVHVEVEWPASTEAVV
jgi:Holliday junction resolvase RusA-like endonuclease